MEPNHQADLETARYLAECGVPIFLLKPDKDFPYGGTGTGYHFPSGWQTTKADPAVLDNWKPGMGIGAVMGHTVDGVDKDPRNGGDLPTDLQPKVYGRQNTPSGGTHDLVAPLGVNSKNGVLPGVDVKAGLPDGSGRGFLFLAPTRKLNHDGKLAKYEWETRPNLESLLLVGGDSSGLGLSQRMSSPRDNDSDGVRSYDGPSYSDLDSGQQGMARSVQAEKIDYWQVQLEDAEHWEEDYRDEKGRGWEALTRDFAWAVASYAVTPWMPLTEQEARNLYETSLPQVIATNPKCKGKWYEGLLDKAAEGPIEGPPWSDFEELDLRVSKSQNLPEGLDEVRVAEWLVESGVSNRYYWTPQLGWLRWDGKRWQIVTVEDIRRSITRALKTAHVRAKDAGLDKNVIKKLSNYLSESKIKALTALFKDQVVADASEFDARAQLLNVANGVVNLKTGDLLPHDPKYMFTKISHIEYHPGYSNEDWTQILTALEPEVVDWMQIRFGQAATGYATPDAVLPVGQGGGSNGKTTLITAIRNCLGEFQVTVPDKVLLSNPSDHPTELTTLFGARAAFIDETPEGRHLNIPRLKSLLGSTKMTARKMHKDNISWDPTHSLFMVTNYLPQISENDEGVIRRLALVKYEKKFPRNDAFYSRVIKRDGPVATAALSWVIEGAKRWYANNKSIPDMPPKVQADTDDWLVSTDPTNEYIEDRFVLDPNSVILVKEVNEDINTWLMMNSMKTWSKNLTASRLPNSASFKNQGIKPIMADRSKKLMEQLDLKFDTEIPSKARVYRGLRWRKTGEPMGFDPTQVHTPEFAEDLI